MQKSAARTMWRRRGLDGKAKTERRGLIIS